MRKATRKERAERERRFAAFRTSEFRVDSAVRRPVEKVKTHAPHHSRPRPAWRSRGAPANRRHKNPSLWNARLMRRLGLRPIGSPTCGERHIVPFEAGLKQVQRTRGSEISGGYD